MTGDIGIGRIIDQERHRDAIHIAVAPMEALVDLKPGEQVAIHEGKAISAYVGSAVGIVDPYLVRTVLPGQVFYVFLFPGTITALRLEWVHPAFDKVPLSVTPSTMPPDKAASEKWLREYARRVNSYYTGDGYYGEKDGGKDTSYEVLMEDLANNCITYHGIDMHDRSELIDEKELAHHASIVLGRPVNFDSFEYFSCSC